MKIRVWELEGLLHIQKEKKKKPKKKQTKKHHHTKKPEKTSPSADAKEILFWKS